MINKTLSAIVLGSAISFSGCGEDKAESNRFPQEKILTISAKEYCESLGKNLSDYEVIGIRGDSSRIVAKLHYDDVPKETEVVVGYTLGNSQVAGTALVLRKK